MKSKPSDSTAPEFVVKRQAFDRYFDGGLPRSTFHDLVGEGRIVPMKGMRGYYLLNDSLRRLGLGQVDQLSPDPKLPTLEDLTRLAFSLIDRNLFPEPSWLLNVEFIGVVEADHAMRIAGNHRDVIVAYDSVELKLAYFQGVLDAAAMLKSDGK